MHSRHSFQCSIAIAAALLLALTSTVTIAEVTIDWYTADGGGWTFSSGELHTLGGTVGQPDAGVLSQGHYELSGGFWKGGEGIPSAIEDLPIDPIEEIAFRLLAGVPNPFSEKTGILLDLPEPRPVEVAIFDHGGRLIRVLCDREMAAGHHHFSWDGRSHAGHRVASGIYLVRVRVGPDEARQRVILLR